MLFLADGRIRTNRKSKSNETRVEIVDISEILIFQDGRYPKEVFSRITAKKLIMNSNDATEN